ncbi:hypothetical protein KSS87_017034 [Heliosperma pusillum]|nr:hypothetical protein KSS87_017034 [Heliosperma pusillum]
MWDSESESNGGREYGNGTLPATKHGLKTDGFEQRGHSWFVATDIPSDFLVQIGEVSFHLHKYPLISRCGKLSRIIYDTHDGELNKTSLDDLPGGAESFELASKFCYGIAVDLTAANISGLRCAAEYLEMTEDLEEGNLIFKTEAFLSYVVLSSWRDSIIVLKSCEDLSPWAENLQIVRRCSESIAWKACANPKGIKWNYTGRPVKGMRFELIGASIMHYATKWIPGIAKDSSAGITMDEFANTGNISKETSSSTISGAGSWKGGLHLVISVNKEDQETMKAKDQRMIIESLISIIPPQRDCVSCSFLLKLLRISNMLKVAPALVTELEKRVGMQFEQATLSDLLIPSYHKSETVYDVDLVQRLLEHFLVQEQTECASPSRQAYVDKSTYDESQRGDVSNAKMRVARLVDSYLTEIARDRNLSLTKFQVLAEALPESARTCDDGLYRAIDSYLKAHATLSEHERKRLCRVMDCQKLSIDACMHAAQNERLPLRVVVQVLFSEQVKISNAIANNSLKDPAPDQNYQPMVSTRKSLLEGTPQSFQEGWTTAKKDINTLKFELDTVKTKYVKLQNEMESLQRQFDKMMTKPKNSSSSAWTSGWKKLSRLAKMNNLENDDSSDQLAPDQTRKAPRRWRNSIS